MTLAEQFRTKAIEQNTERDRATYDAIIEMCRKESEKGGFYIKYDWIRMQDEVFQKLKADGFDVKKANFVISWK